MSRLKNLGAYGKFTSDPKGFLNKFEKKISAKYVNQGKKEAYSEMGTAGLIVGAVYLLCNSLYVGFKKDKKNEIFNINRNTKNF